MKYTIREIEEKDNKEVEKIIRTCLIEFGANHEGTAWTDPNLGRFSEIYNTEGNKYWVAIDENNKIVGGVGIGKLDGIEDVPIEKSQVTELEDKIKENNYVENVDYRLQGRLVNVEVEVSKDADKTKVKELANVLLDTFTNDQKKYYDLQIFISSSDYEINYIGYKHKSSDAFAWTNNE